MFCRTHQQAAHIRNRNAEIIQCKADSLSVRISNNHLYFKKMRNQLREIFMVINDVLVKLSKVKKRQDGYTALCPSHDDKSPSFSIR